MRLSKHHGLGNDFLVVLDQVEPDPALARRLCDRHRGIGADGLVFGRGAAPEGHNRACGGPAGTDPAPHLPSRRRPGPAPGGTDDSDPADRSDPADPADRSEPADEADPADGVDVTMVLYNADGSRAEMSGNGIRCLAQAVLRQRGATSGALCIRTDAGTRRVVVDAGSDPSQCWAEVDMGPARAGPPWRGELPAGLRRALGVEPLGATTVDVGNPHLVLRAADPAAVDLGRFGPALEGAFPGGINVEFVAPGRTRPDELVVTVWERGVGITEACGTGACASAWAAHGWGLVRRNVTVHLPGGSVDVRLATTVTLRGPAVHIGDIEVEELRG